MRSPSAPPHPRIYREPPPPPPGKEQSKRGQVMRTLQLTKRKLNVARDYGGKEHSDEVYCDCDVFEKSFSVVKPFILE